MVHTDNAEENRSDFIQRNNQPLILWIRFFGWFGSGAGVGWFLCDFNGEFSVAIIRTVVILAIVSQCLIFIVPLLLHLWRRRQI